MNEKTKINSYSYITSLDINFIKCDNNKISYDENLLTSINRRNGIE